MLPIPSCFFESFVVNDTHFHHEGREEHEDRANLRIPSVLPSVESVISVVTLEIIHYIGPRDHRENASLRPHRERARVFVIALRPKGARAIFDDGEPDARSARCAGGGVLSAPNCDFP